VLIIMTKLAFERKLLIVQLLKVFPPIQRDIYVLGKAFLHIYLYTNSNTNIHWRIWLIFVDIFP
jgi:hypothetical protein